MRTARSGDLIQPLCNRVQTVALGTQIFNGIRNDGEEVVSTVSIRRRTGDHQDLEVVAVQFVQNIGDFTQNFAHLPQHHFKFDAVRFAGFKIEQERVVTVIQRRALPVIRIVELQIVGFFKRDFPVDPDPAGGVHTAEQALLVAHCDLIEPALGHGNPVITDPLSDRLPLAAADGI